MTDNTDGTSLEDSYKAEVKGPDPKVWGEDDDRPGAVLGETGPGIGEIWNEGTREQVKGPGPEWKTNDEGEYVNREI